MAQFRASIQGKRGPASRLGDAETGITAYINGWNGGLRIEARYVEGEGDRFEVYATHGSGHGTGEPASGFLGYVNDRGIFHPVGVDTRAD